MADFARLEVHDGLQVLCFIESDEGSDGSYGPCVTTRCDPSVSVAFKEGPWPDTEQGWDDAQAAFRGKDLAVFASNARLLVGEATIEQVS
ncbi:MAG: hypothetical protein AAF844_00150 [Pseudomonadota bacterium]